nr:ribonuclease H-like domain-containing protein [Tanacetum cinerariifolium]
MKHYYYAGIHDHIKCVEAEEQRELQSGFYYKLEAKCGDNLIERKSKPKDVRKNSNALIIEEWVSDDEDEVVIQPKGNSQMDLQDKDVIDSGYSRNMTGNMFYLTDYEEIDGGYLARKNELKAKNTLMLAIPDEHLLRFHAYKDASPYEKQSRIGGCKSEVVEKFTISLEQYCFDHRKQIYLDTLTMDDLYKNLKLDNEDLEQIDTNDLKEIYLRWQPVMITMRVKMFIKKTGRNLDLIGKDTVGFDRTKVECYNCHRRGYQIGLESLEARIVVHEKNKAVYEEDIAFLKYDVQVKDISIKDLKNQLENALKEKYDLKLKLEKFETSSKNLTKLINSQISATDKTSLGFEGQVNESEVLNNLVNNHENDGDDNQVNDRFKKGKRYHAVPPSYTGNYMPPRADLSFAGFDNSIFKSKESDSKDENVFKPKDVKKTVKPRLEKIEFLNARNTTVKNENKAKIPRKFSQSPRVLTKSGQVPINTAKQSSYRVAALVSTARHVNTATSRPHVNNALPITYSYFKAHSPVRRLFNQKSVAKTNNFNEKVNTAKVNNVTTARPKAIVSAAEGNRNNGNLQYALQDQEIFVSGCSRHLTGNKSYIIDYQKIDGGFVAFGRNAKGGKITKKGKIRTGKLDFEDVYFVKELKFNLFSVSQMCEKKNSVLFTDTECVVLSPDFKLLDESQVLLKVLRNNSMYSFYLKNVVPIGGLTCLFTKATLDESTLYILDRKEIGAGPDSALQIQTFPSSISE